MFVHRTWYRAAWSHELDSAKPLYRRFLGHDVALFRDATGRAAALDAICPHRGANLGRGRVVDGCLQCPLHGFVFDREGRCVRVPSQPSSEPIPQTARVETYALRERNDVLWIWMDTQTGPDHEPPSYPWLGAGSGFARFLDESRLQKGDFLLTLETAVESSHTHFLHPRTLGPASPIIPRYGVETRPDGRGFRAWIDPDSPWTFATGHDTKEARRWFRRGGDSSEQWQEFDMGGQSLFRTRWSEGSEECLMAFVTPADEDHNHFAVAIADNRKGLGAWIRRKALRRISDPVQDEDEHALGELVLVKRPGGLERPVMVKSDLLGAKLRQLLARHLEAEGRAMPWTPPQRAESASSCRNTGQTTTSAATKERAPTRPMPE